MSRQPEKETATMLRASIGLSPCALRMIAPERDRNGLRATRETGAPRTKNKKPERTGKYPKPEAQKHQILDSFQPFSSSDHRKFPPKGPEKIGENQNNSKSNRKFSADEGERAKTYHRGTEDTEKRGRGRNKI